MTPTFSIIIPVYNVAPYLRECLDSVLAAARTLNEKCKVKNEKCGVEIICVDDGSTDGSGAILDEFQEKIKSAIPNSSFSLPNFLVIHQKNAGSSAARNVGLDHAHGEWVWFVDGDDFVEPNALTTFAALEEKADVTYFSMRVRYADGLYEEKHLTGTGVVCTGDGINHLMERLYHGPMGDVFGWTWDKFIRRKVITEGGIRFDESISFYEDEVFAIRVMEQAQSLATIPDVLYNYRRLNSGLTAKGIPDPYALALAFCAAGGNFTRDATRKLVDLRVMSLLRRALHDEHSFKAAKLLMTAKHLSFRRGECAGGYAKMLKRLAKLPVPVASLILVAFHLVKR